MNPLKRASVIGNSRVWTRVQGVVDETDAAFRGSAFHASLHGGDTGSALFGADGKVWTTGTTSAPFLCGLLEQGLSQWQPTLAEATEGDIFVSNDPFSGGCTLHEIAAVTPLMADSRPVAWLATAGYYPDIGGRVPGGVCPEAWDVMQEGVRFPPRRAASSWFPDLGFVDLVAANARDPEAVKGSLLAQMAALSTGMGRLRAVMQRFGIDALAAASAAARRGACKALSAALEAFSNDVLVCRDRLDTLPLVTRVEVTQKGVQIDFEGAAARKAGVMNATRSAVVAAAVAGVRKVLPDLPLTLSAPDLVLVTIPEHSFLDALYPDAVGGSHEIVDRVMMGVVEALSKGVHGRGSGADGCGSNLLVLEGRDDTPFFLRLTVGSGGGASGRGDGLLNVGPVARRSTFPPIEHLERTYPISVLDYGRRTGSGGPGRYRGGDGTVLEFEVKTCSRLTVFVDRARRGAGGHHRGARGSTASVRIYQNGHWQVGPMKEEARLLESGDRVRIETAGGGGYGHPYERAIRLLSEEVSAGVLTRRAAALDHGVLFRSERELAYDSAATFKLRSYRLTAADVESLLDEVEDMA